MDPVYHRKDQVASFCRRDLIEQAVTQVSEKDKRTTYHSGSFGSLPCLSPCRTINTVLDRVGIVSCSTAKRVDGGEYKGKLEIDEVKAEGKKKYRAIELWKSIITCEQTGNDTRDRGQLAQHGSQYVFHINGNATTHCSVID